MIQSTSFRTNEVSVCRTNLGRVQARVRQLPMWRAPDQESLSLQSTLLPQQEQQGTRNSHDSLFQRRHSGSQDIDCTRTQASEQHNELPHGLQQALLSEAALGPTADLSNMQLDLDNATLATALGLGSENVLAQFHRTLGDQAGQSPSELNTILAASLGVRSMHQPESTWFFVYMAGLSSLSVVGPTEPYQLC